MIEKLRKYLPQSLKKIILDSIIYRLYSRVALIHQEIRLSCELTTRCNMGCDMCTRPSLIKERKLEIGDMDLAVVERVIQEIKKFHIAKRQICFVPMGLGESLLYKGLFELFEKIKSISKRVRIILVTNGILLDESIAENIVHLGIDEVCVSLNVNNSTAYRQHMGIDGYDTVYKNIQNLISLRNKSKERTPSIFVQYIDFNHNSKMFDSDIKRWLKIMCYHDKCYIHPVVNQAGFFPRGNDFGAKTDRFPCTQPLWRVAIKKNGDIFPCDSSFYSGGYRIGSLYLGNIKNDSPFELFVSKRDKNLAIFKKMLHDDYSTIPECQSCNTYKLSANCYFSLPKFLRFSGRKWL